MLLQLALPFCAFNVFSFSGVLLTFSSMMCTMCRLLQLALPLGASNVFSFLLNIIGVAFIGRLGQYELSVSVLATSVFNVTGMSLLMGLAATL